MSELLAGYEVCRLRRDDTCIAGQPDGRTASTRGGSAARSSSEDIAWAGEGLSVVLLGQNRALRELGGPGTDGGAPSWLHHQLHTLP